MNIVLDIIFIIYLIWSYKAINDVWYSKRVYLVHDTMWFYLQKILLSIVFGWFLIPLSIIMKLFKKK